ncbi:MAG: ATP-binding cassette domain-containing protein [Gaiellales bacterium]
MSPAVVARDIGVRFLFDRHRRVVTPTLSRFRRKGVETWGLRGLSLSIGPGEGVALLGPSGSGKTSLLRVIAGVLSPDEGRIEVRGRVGSLLSIDAGLLAPLTGRENATLLGVLAGLSRAESRRALESVKERSRLGEPFERPVASYSQGMRARLGFAVADEARPAILVLDEVHEALDHEFRAVVEQRALEVREAGGIVIATGHDHAILERLCERGVLMGEGQIEADGPFREVQRAYVG